MPRILTWGEDKALARHGTDRSSKEELRLRPHHRLVREKTSAIVSGEGTAAQLTILDMDFKSRRALCRVQARMIDFLRGFGDCPDPQKTMVIWFCSMAAYSVLQDGQQS